MNDNISTSSLLYDGLSEVSRFAKLFRTHARHKQWTNEQQIEYLPDMLIGKAERAFNALDATTERDTIAHALAALTIKLKKPKEELMALFMAEKRRSDESLSRFAFRLQEILVSALPEATADVLNQLLRANILKHVPENIRSLIIFNPNMTWDAVLVALDTAMPQIASSSHSYSSGPSLQQATPLIKTEPSVDANYASSNQPPRSSNNNNQRGNQRHHRQQQGNQQHSQRYESNKYCSFHNSNSHNDDECRMKKTGATQQQQSSPQQYKPQRSTFMRHNNNNNYNNNKVN